MADRESDRALADELFTLIEKEQGLAYISDGIGVLSRDRILAVARGALKSHRKCVRLLEGFLKKENAL